MVEETARIHQMADKKQKSSSADKAKEHRYTGIILLVLSSAMFILMIVDIILPARLLTSGILGYIILSAVSIPLFILGIYSLKIAGQYELGKKAAANIEKRLLDYVSENLTAEKVDSMIIFEKDDGDEIRFFKRSACIRALINRQFMNLDQQMLDTLVDEKIYDMLYEE